MHVHPRTLERLKKRLQNLQRIDDLDAHRALVIKTSEELGMNTLDFAAALLQMTHPHLFQSSPDNDLPNQAPIAQEKNRSPMQRSVRYRLDVGRRHQVSEEDILAVLIEESGVDRKRITRLDMREDHTLVDLPDGMPADIFHLLAECCVKSHPLNIKRLKANRKKPRTPR